VQPAVKDPALQRLGAEVTRLRRENDALLRELETAYAQLTAVLQVSQDETRIAYSELQEKLVVQEKKLVELGFLSSAGEALLGETDLERLCGLVVEKVGLILPVDLALLQLAHAPGQATVRERDLVRDVNLDPPRIAALAAVSRRLDAQGRSIWLVADLDSEPAAADLRLRSDARSAVCLPLRVHSGTAGLLLLNSRLRANFRDDQEPLLATFAHQAAAALASAVRMQRCMDLAMRLLAAHGGTAADLERWTAETAALPAPQAAALRRLVNRSLAGSDSTAAPDPGRRQALLESS
jgi:transcriptional regulator with GAF, ATPase, and Fis domain